MAMGSLQCPACKFEWEVWRQYQATLDRAIEVGIGCPECGHGFGMVTKTYSNIVHFKGEGWTPKTGECKDLREMPNVPDALRKELD